MTGATLLLAIYLYLYLYCATLTTCNASEESDFPKNLLELYRFLHPLTLVDRRELLCNGRLPRSRRASLGTALSCSPFDEEESNFSNPPVYSYVENGGYGNQLEFISSSLIYAKYFKRTFRLLPAIKDNNDIQYFKLLRESYPNIQKYMLNDLSTIDKARNDLTVCFAHHNYSLSLVTNSSKKFRGSLMDDMNDKKSSICLKMSKAFLLPYDLFLTVEHGTSSSLKNPLSYDVKTGKRKCFWDLALLSFGSSTILSQHDLPFFTILTSQASRCATSYLYNKYDGWLSEEISKFKDYSKKFRAIVGIHIRIGDVVLFQGDKTHLKPNKKVDNRMAEYSEEAGLDPHKFPWVDFYACLESTMKEVLTKEFASGDVGVFLAADWPPAVQYAEKYFGLHRVYSVTNNTRHNTDKSLSAAESQRISKLMILEHGLLTNTDLIYRGRSSFGVTAAHISNLPYIEYSFNDARRGKECQLFKSSLYERQASGRVTAVKNRTTPFMTL